MFQGSSTIKVSKKGLGFLKDFVVNGSYEWRVEMPEIDYAVYAENFKNLPQKKAEEEKQKGSVILITRLYLDADLVTEMARDKNSNELFIKRYPEKVEAHWLKINTDLQSLNKLFVQIKIILLGIISVVYLASFDELEDAANFFVVNIIASFIWPKLFSKSIVFFWKMFLKFRNQIAMTYRQLFC